MADRFRYITGWRCRDGHLWLYDHDECPECGGRLAEVSTRSEATIVTHTVVRVNPTGVPIRLGVAVTTTGASTLCIIRGRLRGNGRDRARLMVRGGRFHALCPRHRLDKP
jgi:uncharacterized OB-fold protein